MFPPLRLSEFIWRLSFFPYFFSVLFPNLRKTNLLVQKISIIISFRANTYFLYFCCFLFRVYSFVFTHFVKRLVEESIERFHISPYYSYLFPFPATRSTHSPAKSLLSSTFFSSPFSSHSCNHHFYCFLIFLSFVSIHTGRHHP